MSDAQRLKQTQDSLQIAISAVSGGVIPVHCQATSDEVNEVLEKLRDWQAKADKFPVRD